MCLQKCCIQLLTAALWLGSPLHSDVPISTSLTTAHISINIYESILLPVYYAGSSLVRLFLFCLYYDTFRLLKCFEFRKPPPPGASVRRIDIIFWARALAVSRMQPFMKCGMNNSAILYTMKNFMHLEDFMPQFYSFLNASYKYFLMFIWSSPFKISPTLEKYSLFIHFFFIRFNGFKCTPSLSIVFTS